MTEHTPATDDVTKSKDSPTPGPWRAVNERLVRGPHGEAVAATRWTDQMPVCVQHEANARLIAAAPALLEALEAALKWQTNTTWTRRNPKLEKMVVAAIAQAKGE